MGHYGDMVPLCCRYYLLLVIAICTGKFLIFFSYVKWFKKHRSFDYFGSSAIVVEPFSFIPVQRISNRCAMIKISLKVCYVIWQNKGNFGWTILILLKHYSNDRVQLGSTQIT